MIEMSYKKMVEENLYNMDVSTQQVISSTMSSSNGSSSNMTLPDDMRFNDGHMLSITVYR